MDDLDTILASIWSQLADSAGNPGAQWGLPALGTVGEDGAPQQRTVVLRGVDPVARSLHCYTDGRAQKAGQIQLDARTSWLFYDRQQRVQVVLSGEAEVRTQGDFVRRAWELCGPDSRRNYSSIKPPGTAIGPVAAPVDEASGILGHLPLIPESLHTPRHFAVITARIDFIDWLRLLPEGNVRAQFWWTGNGWNKTWVTP